jgi:predicted TIM-barrel fold metal-dependent hydrolase
MLYVEKGEQANHIFNIRNSTFSISTMILDCHVHVSACTPGHGVMSETLQKQIAFRFLRWKFGLVGVDETTERAFERILVDTLNEVTHLDAAVVLAFDAVYDRDGNYDTARTHFHVTNDYVIELAKRHPKMLFGASVHPYRKDAVAELERCIQAGALLLKWLPITQDFNPADERCFEFYDALVHYRLPLLSHTGGEKSLPQLDKSVADPMLLVPALKRGVTVIAAHCGTRSAWGERDYVNEFMQLAREYEHFYGDTSAINLPPRWHAYRCVMNDPIVSRKLIHGSDWPIISIPPGGQIGWDEAMQLMFEPNWIRRDMLIKQRLGFDAEYWHRAGKILRVGERTGLRH